MKKRTITPCSSIPITHTIHDTLSSFHSFLTDFKHYNPVRKSHSLERQQLARLKRDYPLTVFKPADKNLGLVALDLADYHKMVMTHLSDESVYSCVTSNESMARLLFGLNNIYKRFVGLHPWYPHEKKFLLQQTEFQTPKFYCLPKLHKAGSLKGRPIAGATNWITTPISRILEMRIQPLIQEHFQSVLKNSLQLVEELNIGNLSNAFNSSVRIITGDVESLYPNINIARLKKIIHKLDFTLTDLATFVCDNSYVEYNNHLYHQLSGIAMGTNAAVSLANIYMGEIVDKFIAQQPQVLYYKRYIDDLFILWTGSDHEWNRLSKLINKLDPNLHINFCLPTQKPTPFLDLNIYYDKFNNRICTSVFQKELNKYMYLTTNSHHPPHTFSGFIKGELTRYARLSTEVFGFEHMKKLFLQRLINRGYNRRFLHSLFNQVHWHHRTRPRSNPRTNLLPFVIPYTSRGNMKILQAFFRQNRDVFEDYLPSHKVILVFKKTPNIANIITRSSLTPAQTNALALASIAEQRADVA